MFASFYYTLTRNDEDVDVLVEYQATKSFGDVDIDLISVILDGAELDTSETEDRELIQACFDRVDEDFWAEAEAYGDYRYEQSRDDY